MSADENTSTNSPPLIEFFPVQACYRNPQTKVAGRVPYSIGLDVYKGWSKKFGSPALDPDRQTVYIASIGGFNHYEMDAYGSDKQWRDSFEPSETLMKSAVSIAKAVWCEL